MVDSCCCCVSLEAGYKVMGLICCLISVIAFAFFSYSFTMSSAPFEELLGGGFLISYGTPATYWILSQMNPDQNYKRMFAKTYVWLTSIWWLLMILFLGLIVLALGSFDSPAPDGSAIRVLGVAVGLWLVFAVPNYYVYCSLDAYAQ